jgi:hypothetical protein
MVHGILQFTPSIAFRYVLHRCENRDIRCRESFRSWKTQLAPQVPSLTNEDLGARFSCSSSLTRLASGFVFGRGTQFSSAPGKGAESGGSDARHKAPPGVAILVRGSFCLAGLDNDPSAGSPTETLLRLLLPLNDKVQWTSRDVAGGEPPTSPRSEHFTGPFNR